MILISIVLFISTWLRKGKSSTVVEYQTCSLIWLGRNRLCRFETQKTLWTFLTLAEALRCSPEIIIKVEEVLVIKRSYKQKLYTEEFNLNKVSGSQNLWE